MPVEQYGICRNVRYEGYVPRIQPVPGGLLFVGDAVVVFGCRFPSFQFEGAPGDAPPGADAVLLGQVQAEVAVHRLFVFLQVCQAVGYLVEHAPVAGLYRVRLLVVGQCFFVSFRHAAAGA